MSANRSPERQRVLGFDTPESRTARLALALAVVVVIAAFFVTRERRLSSDVLRLRQEVQAASLRQRELEGQVARQHASLLHAESELEAVRLQMEAVELQLDGVDFLSREVRGELGLPDTAGTWEGAAPIEAPQGGGPGASGTDAQRLALAQQRLARGLQELHDLLEYARARGAPQPETAAAVEARPASRLPTNWPARGTVTSDYGWRWFRGLPNFHTGIDIALDYGTPVAATGDGMVLGSGWQPNYGWSVFIQHDQGYHTLFAHLSVTSVDVGDAVEPGTLIGLSGSSGTSTGPHLHYEVWKDGRPIDPRPFMDGSGSR